MDDVTCRRPITWQSAAQTHVGNVRKVNEDSLIALPETRFWAVADGMGGHARGDVASQKITHAMEYLTPASTISQLVSSVEDRLLTVNQQLLEYSRSTLERKVMGSTFVGFMVERELGVCLWVGDSRLYRYRNNKLEQLSRDHSQVEELLQAGAITPEQAENHPQGNVITRAVGVTDNLLVDILAFPINVGDTFLLCSDGLYNCVSQDGIMASVKHANLEQACNELIDKALENGAKDNVSVVVVRAIPDNSFLSR